MLLTLSGLAAVFVLGLASARIIAAHSTNRLAALVLFVACFWLSLDIMYCSHRFNVALTLLVLTLLD